MGVGSAVHVANFKLCTATVMQFPVHLLSAPCICVCGRQMGLTLAFTLCMCVCFVCMRERERESPAPKYGFEYFDNQSGVSRNTLTLSFCRFSLTPPDSL